MGNPVKLAAWLVLPIVALVVVGAVAWWAVSNLLGYLILGAIVVGGGALVYRKVKRSIGPGTRNRNRIEAARETYRMRKNG